MVKIKLHPYKSFKFASRCKPKTIEEADKQIRSYGAEYIKEDNSIKYYLLEQRVSKDSLDRITFSIYPDNYIIISISTLQVLPETPDKFNYDAYFKNKPIEVKFYYWPMMEVVSTLEV